MTYFWLNSWCVFVLQTWSAAAGYRLQNGSLSWTKWVFYTVKVLRQCESTLKYLIWKLSLLQRNKNEFPNSTNWEDWRSQVKVGPKAQLCWSKQQPTAARVRDNRWSSLCCSVQLLSCTCGREEAEEGRCSAGGAGHAPWAGRLHGAGVCGVSRIYKKKHE